MDWSWKSSCHTASRLRVDEAVAPKLRSIHATLQPWNTFEGALQSLVSSRAGSFCRAASLSEHAGSQPNQQQRSCGRGAGEAEQQPINDAAPRRAAEDVVASGHPSSLRSERVRARRAVAACRHKNCGAAADA